MLYEEGLDDYVMSSAMNAIQTADMMIIAGTSLAVYPAAGLIRYYSGNKLVLIIYAQYHVTPKPFYFLLFDANHQYFV